MGVLLARFSPRALGKCMGVHVGLGVEPGPQLSLRQVKPLAFDLNSLKGLYRGVLYRVYEGGY